MAIHHLLPTSYGACGACHCRSYGVSAQPGLDHPALLSCSAVRSSLSESMTYDILLRDSVSDPDYGAQQKYLEDDRPEDLNDHPECVNRCEDFKANGRLQVMDHVEADCSDRCPDRDISFSSNDDTHSIFSNDDQQKLMSEFPYPSTSEGLDADAHFIASDLRTKTVHSSSLRDHLEAQSVEDAVHFLGRMVDEPLPTYVFIPILKNCRKQKALPPARHLHLHMCKHGLEFHKTFRNFLITIHVNCGFVNEAHRLVSQLYEIDQHSWNTLIQGYLDSGQSKKAFKLYKEMEASFVQCRRYILMALLQTFSSQQCLEECQELHSKIVERELETDLFFCNTVVDLYLKCDRLIDAQDVFDEQVSKDVVLFSTLIIGLTNFGRFEDALRCWDQVVIQSLDPDIPTCVFSLKACANLEDPKKGREIHTSAVKHMFEKDVSLGNSLVDMYAKCGELSDSQAVFDELPVRDVVSWSALITGYADNGFGEKALTLYDQMLLSGNEPNDVTFLGALKACVSMGAQEKGQELHADIVKEEYESYPLVSSALIDMYSKCGLLSEGRYLFSMMRDQNVITWTALIEAYVKRGLFGRAFTCFGQMQSRGILPNNVTFLCLLNACCNCGMIGKGRYLHSEIVTTGFEGDLILGSMLVHMYVKCGSLQDARLVFGRLPIQTEMSWTSIIVGLMKNKHEKEAFNHFQEMKRNEVLPEPATYVALLKGSGSEESLEYGQIVHMEIVYRGLEKHACISPALVYMYAKNDSLAEAQILFNSLHSPDTAICNMLISSFLEQGLHEMVFLCFEKMEMKNVQADVITWSLCVKACQCRGLLSKVYRLHLQIVKQGCERHSSISTLILDTYAFHRMPRDSHAVFKSPPNCDSFKWTRLVAASRVV